MPRTKEFDPDTVLRSALELFWERGYERTSMADLVQHLGIGRASIYATFGNKHELYLRALQRYLELQQPNPIELLSQPGPVLPAVRALIESYVDDAVADQRRRGCLVVNTAVELPRDPQAARCVTNAWDTLEVALTAALTRASAQGELAADADPRALARFLLVTMQGIRLVGKVEPQPARLRDAAELALRALG